ncbi:hypothetical protein E4M02_00265 [Brevundimonas sp. S30B]|nr:hypothetical protein E4M01_07555 [Brevundimonas sp. MF30-B]TFW04587.1 hypothetical protein E4M02_00265 [Brevundimonas sp. S30B]
MVGPMQWLVGPALAAAAATLVLTTPLQVFGLKLPEPILPLVLAIAWPLIRPSMTAPVVVLGLGLFLDLVLGGPLGLWAVALLSAHGVALLSRNLLAGQATGMLFAWYAGLVAFAFVLAHLIVTLRTGVAPSLVATAWQAIATLLLFPLADWLIQRFDDGDVRFR